MTSPLRALLPFALALTPLAAQRALATVYGTVTEGGLGTQVLAPGDVDRDGVGDFVVTEPTHDNRAGAAYLISGATRQRLATFLGSTASGVWGMGFREPASVGDVDGDGRMDFAFGYVNRGPLDVFSGATGARLYRMGPAIEFLHYACAAGDLDTDGREDFVAYAYINSNTQLWTVRGLTGSLLTMVMQNPQSTGPLRNVGDVTGDGKPEVAICGSYLEVYDLHPPRRLFQARIPLGSVTDVEIADWDNDGRRDVVYGCVSGGNQPFVVVMSPVNGAQIATLSMPADDTVQPSGQIAVLPDMDGDGHVDLAAPGLYDPLALASSGVMVILSGSDGRRIGAWPGSPAFSVGSRPVMSPGDVDGDGFGDFVIGNADTAGRRGGWQLVSGRAVGTALAKPVNCFSGPFPPQFGVSRPALGQSMTLAGRDAPPGTLCTLAMSLLPRQRTNLGVAGCDAWVDPASWLTLVTFPATPSWQFAVPLPDTPLLSGLEVAMQAFYAGTTTPIGFDLSNGVWARFGL